MTALQWSMLGFTAWLFLGINRTLGLYTGYGFAMNAQYAAKNNRSQAVVLKADKSITVWWVFWDAYLNLLFYTFIALDVRPSTSWNLITGRLCIYNAPGYGADASWLTRWWYSYHKWLADFGAAFLDGKDIVGEFDHVKGKNNILKWLGAKGGHD